MQLLFRLLLFTILGFSQTLNEQIQELQHASKARRVELMNHIKKQLILMNQKERLETIIKLKRRLQPDFDATNSPAIEPLKGAIDSKINPQSSFVDEQILNQEDMLEQSVLNQEYIKDSLVKSSLEMVQQNGIDIKEPIEPQDSPQEQFPADRVLNLPDNTIDDNAKEPIEPRLPQEPVPPITTQQNSNSNIDVNNIKEPIIPNQQNAEPPDQSNIQSNIIDTLPDESDRLYHQVESNSNGEEDIKHNSSNENMLDSSSRRDIDVSNIRDSSIEHRDNQHVNSQQFRGR